LSNTLIYNDHVSEHTSCTPYTYKNYCYRTLLHVSEHTLVLSEQNKSFSE